MCRIFFAELYSPVRIYELSAHKRHRNVVIKSWKVGFVFEICKLGNVSEGIVVEAGC